MADETVMPAVAPRTKDEIALELMKFISITTGYGKGAPAAGFGGKHPRTPEEHAEALLGLFQRCRAILYADPQDA